MLWSNREVWTALSSWLKIYQNCYRETEKYWMRLVSLALSFFPSFYIFISFYELYVRQVNSYQFMVFYFAPFDLSLLRFWMMRRQLTMSSEPNSVSGGTELHLETYTNPSEPVNAHIQTRWREVNLVLLAVHTHAHQKTEYLIHSPLKNVLVCINICVCVCDCRGWKFPKRIG